MSHKRLLIPRRRFLAGAAGSLLLPRTAWATYCGQTTSKPGFVSSGRKPFWCASFNSYVNASGTSGAFGTGVTDTDRYDQTACDNCIGDLGSSGMKFDMIALQIMPAIVNGSDSVGPGPRTETQAGIIRAAKNVVNSGADLCFKIQLEPNPNGAFNRTSQFQPATSTGFGTNYKSWLFAFMDVVEANLPIGKHVRGLVLTCELDQLATSTYVPMFSDIVSKTKARYPHLVWIINMPTSFGGTGFGGFGRAPLGYDKLGLDALCCDLYALTRTDSEAGPLSIATYESRYGNPNATSPAGVPTGGPGNFWGLNAPPVGLNGTSWPSYIATRSANAGLQFIDAEAGCPASVSSVLGAVDPAADGAGGQCTAAGALEQFNYMSAVVDSVKRVAAQAGVIFHEYGCVDDITNSFLGTDGFRFNQMKLYINLLLQQTGGTYGTFSPSNQAGVPPRGLSFVLHSDGN